MNWDLIIQSLIVAGVTAFATGFVNGKVMEIKLDSLRKDVKDWARAHETLAQEFRVFRLEYAGSSVTAKQMDRYHERLRALEDAVLRMGVELHGRGYLKETPQIAEGLGWK